MSHWPARHGAAATWALANGKVATTPQADGDIRGDSTSDSVSKSRDKKNRDGVALSPEVLSTFLDACAQAEYPRQPSDMTPAKKKKKKKKAGITPPGGVSISEAAPRAEEAWEQRRALAQRSATRRDIVPDGLFAKSKGTQDPNRAPYANGLGKRPSSPGNSEEDPERKRRAVEDRASPVPVPILRAVRSAPHKSLPLFARSAKPKEAVLQVLETARSGRSYKIYEDGLGFSAATSGAIIPDGYEPCNDKVSPWICPIRSCRRLYRSLHALGAHFGAGHRYVAVNDNGDGTLSVVGKFSTAPGETCTCRVVSQKPLDENQPPMATPQTPDHVKPLTRRTPFRRERSPPPEPTTESSLSPVIPSTGGPGTEVMSYLRSVLPADFDFGHFAICKDGPLLLQLPLRRKLTSVWVDRATLIKFCGRNNLADSTSRRCLIAILFQLTGTLAKNPCLSCKKECKSAECVVPSPSFPSSILDKYEDVCAACYYKFSRWRQKSQCPMQADAQEAREKTSQESTSADDEVSSGMDEEFVSDPVMPAEKVALVHGNRAAHDSPDGPPTRPASYDPSEKTPHSTATPMPERRRMSVNMLEMEDWELAPGTLRTSSDEPENWAFSNVYLFSNAPVPVAPGLGLNSMNITSGGSHKFPAQESTLLCRLLSGELSVKMTRGKGPDETSWNAKLREGSTFKVSPGVVCGVQNRLYMDAQLFIITLE